MKKELENAFNIKINEIIKITNKVYEVVSLSNHYILKEYDNKLLENIFSRLYILNINEFLIPIKTKDNRFFIYINNKEYALFEKKYEDDYETKEIKLNYFINALGNLHAKTKYLLKSTDGYFKEVITYLDNKREKVRSDILIRISSIEQTTYHSPTDWFFYMNYQKLYNAIKESERYTSLLEEERDNEKNIRIVLNYNNFSFDHVLPKENKVISLDKMGYGTNIYDIIDLIEKTYLEEVDISKILSQYEEINKLELYEKYYLFAYLYIPLYQRKENQIDDIMSLTKTLERIDLVNQIASSYFEENS